MKPAIRFIFETVTANRKEGEALQYATLTSTVSGRTMMLQHVRGQHAYGVISRYLKHRAEQIHQVNTEMKILEWRAAERYNLRMFHNIPADELNEQTLHKLEQPQ